MSINNDVVYIHFNNWTADVGYPDIEPIATYIEQDIFIDEEWVAKQKLVVVAYTVDMSLSLHITAPRSWVKEHCPELLTEYKQYLKNPNENKYTKKMYLPYREKNIGVHWITDPYLQDLYNYHH